MINIQERLHKRGVSGSRYTRFLNQVSEFEKKLFAFFDASDFDRILDTLELMVELHIDQAIRYDGTEYIEHPLAVAFRLLEAMLKFDAEAIIAALLHDTVEDQIDKLIKKVSEKYDSNAEKNASKNVYALDNEKAALALYYIEYHTQSVRVKNIISGLTNPNFDQILEKKGIGIEDATYRTARNELYAEHVAHAIQDPDVGLVKIFDFEVNVQSIDTIPDKSKRVKFVRKYNPVVPVIIDRLRNEKNPLNITTKKREELVHSFTIVFDKMI